MKTHPDSAVTTTIERYLDAIRAREQRYKPSASAFLEAGIGYDSNINSGVDNAKVSLPVLGVVILLPAGVKKSDGFTYLALGGQGTLPLAPGVTVFGALRADTELHFNDDQFNRNNYNISGGMTLLRDKNFYRATLAYGGLTLDNNRYRDVAGLTGDWRHQWDKFKSLDGYAQYLKLDYAGANSIRDSDFYSLGLGMRFDSVAPWQPLFYTRAYLSREDNEAGLGHLSRDMYGLRLSASVSPAPKWALSAGLTYQHSDYDAPEPVFQTTRKDKYYLFDVGGGYAFTPALSLRAEMLSYKNDSNLALYEYRRDVVAMKLRYDLK